MDSESKNSSINSKPDESEEKQSIDNQVKNDGEMREDVDNNNENSNKNELDENMEKEELLRRIEEEENQKNMEERSQKSNNSESELKAIEKESNDNFSGSEANSEEKDDIKIEPKRIINIRGDDNDKDSSSSDGGESDNGDNLSKHSEIRKPMNLEDNENIYEFYENLRKEFAESGQKWEDPEFPSENEYLYRDQNNPPEKLKNAEWERIDENTNNDDPDAKLFVLGGSSQNINYQFTIKRGCINDKFFISTALMLFKRREEFFTNLIVDIENVEDNLKAGFIGFNFFINGNWKTVTIDTRIPSQGSNEYILSSTEMLKTSFWLTLFEKAYAKIYGNYEILNDVSIKNLLVDFTGGVSKKIKVKKDQNDDNEKKNLFDEMKRCITQNYLMGCLRYQERGDVDLDDSKSSQGDEEEEIISNSMYVILDIKEHESTKLIYLVNYWAKGKWTKDYGLEDERWETVKSLKEKLGYETFNDGSFWMQFDDWVQYFDTLYYCRMFPQNWSQYCIPGSWDGIYSGGAPPGKGVTKGGKEGDGKGYENKFSNSPKKKFEHEGNSLIKKNTIFSPDFKSRQSEAITANKQGGDVFNFKSDPKMSKINFKITNQNQNQNQNQNKLEETKKQNTVNLAGISGSMKKTGKEETQVKEFQRRIILNESEDRWFLNPQFKLEVKYNTKIIITLLQEDEKLVRKPYQKCNFLIFISKNKYSRIWDIKDEYIIKKAVNDYTDKSYREIIVNLDYWELEKKYKMLTKKKNVSKTDIIYLNVIPYIEYHNKIEIEKSGNTKIFKLFKLENSFWLRIFASEEINVFELPKPHEKSIEMEWNSKNAGGARYIRDIKNRLVENPNWPLNPQFLLAFENSLHMKIILRKTVGHNQYEDSNVGFILTKPFIDGNPSYSKATKTKGSVNKKDQMQRILDSTNKILENRKIDFERISRKLSFHANEFVVESSYINNYCSSIYKFFNKIDSPLLIIPTLDKPECAYGFKLAIYSNKPVELISLNSETSQTLISEWTLRNSGGCHLIMDEKKKSKDEELSVKKVIWYDNPKFHLWFESKTKIPELEFDVVISRLDNIWQKIIAKSVVNAMMGLYIFRYDKEKWKEYPIQLNDVNFSPKNEIELNFKFTNIDPRGFILMPATYGSGIAGPFSIMVRSKEKFTLEPFGIKTKAYD